MVSTHKTLKRDHCLWSNVTDYGDAYDLRCQTSQSLPISWHRSTICWMLHWVIFIVLSMSNVVHICAYYRCSCRQWQSPIVLPKKLKNLQIFQYCHNYMLKWIHINSTLWSFVIIDLCWAQTWLVTKYLII